MTARTHVRTAAEGLRLRAIAARAEAAEWEAEGIDSHLVKLRRRDADLLERRARELDERDP